MHLLDGWLASLKSSLATVAGYCTLCQGRAPGGQALCEGCKADLPFLGPACERCALPLSSPGLCGGCLRKPPAYDRCYAAFRYAYPVNRLLTALKFQHRLAYADLLGQLAADSLSAAVTAKPECLLPMPLHPKRLRERGFNQALELAKAIGRHTGIPLATDCCQRIRHTAPQTGLSAKDRRRNVKGAFAVLRPLPYGHVAIVDDIVTTGRSVEELALTLRRAGIRQIDIWACARTPVQPK